MDIKEKVIEIFEEILDTDEIRDNMDLDMFENEMLDSLAIIEVLLGIEDKLGISLQPTDLERRYGYCKQLDFFFRIKIVN